MRPVSLMDFAILVPLSISSSNFKYKLEFELDSLFLASETSNLDGETNLKVRQSLPETAQIVEAKDLSKLTGFVECELPNRNLYEFIGKMRLNNGA